MRQQRHKEKEALPPTAVAVAQLPFLENSF